MNEQEQNTSENGGIRINKFLASCGVDSRRVADRLIEEGRVEVNGKVVTAPGMKVSSADFVKVDGRHMTPMEEVVVLLNKPRGYVCSREAQGAIGTVYDLLPPRLHHLNYVGRLDADSEGLLVMTNKGELTQQLSHPTNGTEKEYWVTVDQNFDNSVLLQFLRGVRIPEGNAKAKYVCRASARRAHVVLEQGLKRQIRQMFQCLGLRVRKLVRVRIGSLWGGDLEVGAWRFLDDNDMALMAKNPPRQRKYLAARDLTVNRPDQGEAPAAKTEDDDSYEFNPADFEQGDSYELSPEMKTQFADFGEESDDEFEAPRRREFDRSSVRRESFNKESGFGGERRERREGGFQRREGGFGGGRREGGFGGNRGERREGGFQRREGGFGGGRREGGFGGNRGERREGGFQRREGGFGGGRREGGFGGERGERREGGFQRREGGFGGRRREGGFGGNRGERREGGFQRREGGFGGGRREGGFGGNRGERREGGFQRREGGFGGGRREGGFGGERGERREGGFQRREGGFGGGRREGGFGGERGERREGGFQRREGGFGGGRREGGFGGGRGERREGGFQRREGGFGGGRREGGFGDRRNGGDQRRSGGFGKPRRSF